MSQPRYPFAQLVDALELQILMDRVYQVSGIALSIFDVDGVPLAHSGRLPLPHDGDRTLVGVTMPIVVDGVHLATVVAGEDHRLDAPIESRRDSLLHAHRLSRERIDGATRLLAQAAAALGEAGLARHRAGDEHATALKATRQSTTPDEPNEILCHEIVDTAGVAIFLLDPQTRIVKANQRMAEMFAMPVERLTGFEYATLISPDYKAIAHNRMRDWINSQDPTLDVERIFRRASHTDFWGQLSARRIVDADGNQTGIVCVITDISKRKQAESIVEQRIVALAAAVDVSNITLDDLFDRNEMQRIQDDFSDAVGVSSGITYPDGRLFTQTSNTSHLCSGIIRQTAKGCANCMHSDAIIGRYHPEGPIVQRCMSGGLWDAGASIMVGNHHVGNWLIGQVRDETQTEEGMRAYAREIGADENEVAQAFGKITAMSREHFERIAKALFTMAQQLSATAFQNVQQARLIKDLRLAQKELKLAASVFTHAREGIMITSASGEILDVNDAFCAITGYTREEVIGNSPRLLRSGRHEAAFYASFWRDLTTKGHWYGEIWNRRKDGEVYAVMQTISAIQDEHGVVTQYVALFSDITLLKEHQSQLEHIAHYDALTTLPNRVLLADRMRQAMTQTQRRGDSLAVAYLDLDGFKLINDMHGHEIGDQLLVAIASRMKSALREGDTLARLGGDEFVAVLLDLDDVPSSLPMLSRLLDAASFPVNIGEHMLQVSASIGLTFFPQTEDADADQLLRQADQAMYQAKLAGKNRFHVFDAEQDRSVRGYHESLENIRRALIGREFILFYQPKVNMRTGEIIGAEALIRWLHPERGMLPPTVFLPVIEDHPLAVEIGEWVIETALTQIDQWRAIGLDIPISVNVGARQLQQPDFIARLCGMLANHPAFQPGDLELEVLETSALEDLARVSEVIEACSGIGISFALDDFGTGYSSLTYLKLLAVSQLKIDQSFVRDMLDDPDDLAILGGVLGLATALRRQVIAEGVATVAHGTMLLQLGCELAQGYGIAHPMHPADFPIWAAGWHPDPAWVNQPPIEREDFPLLFAGAEHRAWLQAISDFINGARENLPLIHYQCHFLTWLENEGRQRHAAHPGFADIEHAHKQLHGFAETLCELKRQGEDAKALDGLRTLQAMHESLIDQLQQLARTH